MPAPANRWASRSRSRALRRATQNSPSSVASIQPTGPGVPAAVHALELGDRRERAARRGSPPTAGVGCSSPASSTAERGSASWARIGVARCWMFATLTSSGSGAASTQTDVRAQRALDPPDDDLVLARGPCRCAAAARRGGRRPRGRRCAGSSRRARRSRRRRPSGARAAPGWRRGRRPRACRSRSRSRTGTARAARRRAPPGRGRAAASTDDLAGEHDLARSPRRGSARRAAATDGLELARAARRCAIRACAGRVRVEQRQRRLAQRRPAARASRRAARVGVAAGLDAPRRAVRKRLARRAGRARPRAGPASAGGNEDQCGVAPAVGVEGEAADPDRAGAGGQAARLVGDRVAARSAAHAAATSREAARAARDDLVGAPERREREPVAVRLLPAEPAVAGQPRGEDGRARIVELDRDA